MLQYYQGRNISGSMPCKYDRRKCHVWLLCIIALRNKTVAHSFPEIAEIQKFCYNRNMTSHFSSLLQTVRWSKKGRKLGQNVSVSNLLLCKTENTCLAKVWGGGGGRNKTVSTSVWRSISKTANEEVLRKLSPLQHLDFQSFNVLFCQAPGPVISAYWVILTVKEPIRVLHSALRIARHIITISIIVRIYYFSSIFCIRFILFLFSFFFVFFIKWSFWVEGTLSLDARGLLAFVFSWEA